MFFREPRYLAWTGAILYDDRFTVRLGVAVLFEELQKRRCSHLHLAVPSLTELLGSEQALLRGEALGVLATIGDGSLRYQAEEMLADENPQVREIAADIINSLESAEPRLQRPV